MTISTIDPSEVAKFEAMAAEWWDPQGKFKPLHEMKSETGLFFRKIAKVQNTQ